MTQNYYSSYFSKLVLALVCIVTLLVTTQCKTAQHTVRTEEEKAIIKSHSGMPEVPNMGAGSRPGSLPTLDKNGAPATRP